MKTKILQSINLIRRGSGANLNLFRYAAKSCDSQGVVTATSYGASDEHPMSIHSASVGNSWRPAGRMLAILMLLISLGIGNAWAGGPYYYAKLTVKVGETGAGMVYGSTTNTNPTDDQYKTSDVTVNDNSSAKNTNKTYYMWAKAKRGAVFTGWSCTKTTGNTFTAPSKPDGDADAIVIKTPNGDSSADTEVTATATWTTYSAATVTYQTPTDGSYEVRYQYTDYNSTNKSFDAIDETTIMAEGAAAQAITSYTTDVITLKTSASNFEGWFSDPDCKMPLPGSSKDTKEYTYVAPNGGTASVYAKFKHTTKFYGKLTAKLASVSPADGGSLYASAYASMDDATFSMADQVIELSANAADDSQTSVDQTYYLHAQATDSRYKFRGWYSDDACTTLLSPSMDYAYTLSGVSSTNSASPDAETVYACFERASSHFLRVDALPNTAGLGMVHVNDERYARFPYYTLFENVASKTVIVNSTNATTVDSVFLYAQPKYGYKFTGWYDNAACTGSVASTANPYKFIAAAASTDPLLPTKHVLYAKFEIDATFNVTYNLPTNGQYSASVLDIVNDNGNYVWGQTQVYSSEGKTANTVVTHYKTGYLTLSAIPDAGYKVTKWTDGSTTETTASWVRETTVEAAKTVSVTFAETEPYKVGNNKYTTLDAAINAAGTSGTIIVVEDAYVPAGTYTIPSGTKLFVPYNDAYTQYGATAGVQPYGTTKKAPTVYKKLTLSDGAHIVVNGTIEVGGIQNLNGQHGAGCGIPDVAYGQIEMLGGSTITLNNGAKMYVWGHITGKFVNGKYLSGTITAKNGSEVQESFQVMDFKGGTITSSLASSLFPMTQYYIQNIQSPITFEYGAVEKLDGGVTASSKNRIIENMTFISTSGGMFNLGTGATVCKEYDPLKDRLVFTLTGDATISDITVSIQNLTTVNSSDYRLPFTNNIIVKILSGTTTVNAKLELTADTEINIAKGASVQVGTSSSTSKELILIDKNEWGNFCNTNVKIYPLLNVPLRQFTRTGANMQSARLKVQGTLDVYGSLFTTESGAVINSEGYSGQINIHKKAPDDGKIKHSSNGTSTVISHTITAAKLLNSDGSFTATKGASAGAEFYYIRGLWMQLTKDGCFYKDPQNHLFVLTNEEDFMEVLDASPAYPAAYKATDCPDLVYIHTANNCEWVPTHTVADNATLLKGMDDKYWQYSETKGYWEEAPSFTVTFQNFNGTVLETATIYNNGTPAYTGYTPVRASDENGAYTFTGWSPAIGAVTANATYTAQYSCTPYVASVTAYGLTQYYTTLSDAIASANGKTGAIVKMLQGATITSQIEITKAMTIDLNGKTISSTQAARVGVFKINASGKTVTITGSGSEGKIDHTATVNDHMYGIWLTAGSLNIEGGTIYVKNNAAANNSYRAYGIWTDGGSSITMSNGKIEATSKNMSFGIYAGNACEITMTGGTITSSGNSSIRGIYTQGKTELTNATITVTAADASSNCCVFYAKQGALTINGGTYTASGAGSSYVFTMPNESQVGSITIKGGLFNGATKEVNKAGSYGTVSISGGYYAHNTDLAGYCTANHYVFGLTAAENEEVGSYYNYKVAEAYTITFKDGDNVLQSGLVEKDETPIYTGDTPTKTATAQYTYTFTGWDYALAPVTSDATYTAQFSSTVNKYTVTFKNGDDVLQSTEWEYGVTPSYDGATPVSPEDNDQYVHPFTGWSPAVTSVTREAIYMAAFGPAEAKMYPVVWKDWNGTTLAQDTKGWGWEIPTYKGTTPTRETAHGMKYTFVGWKQLESEVEHGDVTFKARYSAETGENATPEEVINVAAEEKVDVVTMTIPTGTSLEIADGGSVEADVFIIQATTEDQGEDDAKEEVQVSGELSETGSKNVSAIYYDLTRKGGLVPFLARVWYAVAVPWAVEVPNYNDGGVFIKRGEEFIPQRLGATFDLISYDGECRATNGASANCWKYLEDEIIEEGERVMVPGKLYMIYLTEETYTIRFKKKDGVGIHTNTLTVSACGGSGNDANWNGIANPATYRAYMNVAVDGLVQKFVPGTQPRDGGRYLPIDLSDKQSVGQPFFVQVASTTESTIQVTRKNNPSASAPRRMAANGEQEVRYAIGIAANGKLADRLYIQTAEEKEDEYIIGKDMSKMSVSSRVAQIWVNRYDSKLCLNTAVLDRDKASYPLGIYAPQAGEYKIFAPADIETNDNIYLTLDGRVIWNLTMAPYYASLEQGTTNRYGLRLVRNNAPAVSTDVENLKEGTYPAAQKIIIEDKVYILRGENLYSIDGQLVK